MSRVFLDTNVLVYYFEDHGQLGARCQALFDAMRHRQDQVVISSLTIAELLVKPKKMGHDAIATQYKRFLSEPAFEIIDFDPHCAETFATLRGTHQIKVADAIQLACAARSKCDLMITNDLRLSKIYLPGIPFVFSLDNSPI